MLLSPEDIDSGIRLLAAMAVGMAIGLNRDLHGKPLGMRTLGLVALGAALVALAGLRFPVIGGDTQATGRVVQGVIQGVLTGIGFLGAGVVLRNPQKLQVYGLTSAATVWAAATLGLTCALASWPLILFGVAGTLFLLVVVRPLELMIEHRFALGLQDQVERAAFDAASREPAPRTVPPQMPSQAPPQSPPPDGAA